MNATLAVAIISALAVSAAPEPKTAASTSHPFTVQKRARAYTLDTASVIGGALLRANDHVDVIAVLQDEKRLVSVMLLQNVIVLANASPAPGEARQLSLLVIPEEAQLLAVAKETGHLTMVLREETDTDVLEERGGVTVSNAISGQFPPPAAKPKK